jgi:hypothetical protein
MNAVHPWTQRCWHVTAGKDAAQKLSAFGDITFMQLDTSDKNSVSRFAEQVGEKHSGSIGLLVSHCHTRTADAEESDLS